MEISRHGSRYVVGSLHSLSIRNSLSAAVLLVVLLVTAACSPDGQLATDPDVGSTVGEATSNVNLGNNADVDGNLQTLARSMAIALAEPNVRASLLRGMRASTFNEHKLVLSDFLSSDAGHQLRDRASQNAAIDAILSDLDTQVPSGFDFYVPSPGQRRSWIGTGNLLVVAVSDTDVSEAQAFDTSGNEIRISSLDVPGVDVVLVIHPAEPKTQFVSSQPATGNTIEDESLLVESGATSNQVCPDPEVCGGSGGGGPPPADPNTRVTRIQPFFNDGLFAGDLEIFFMTGDVNDPFTERTESGILHIPGDGFISIVNREIFPEPASSFVVLNAEMWESDGFFGGGNDFRGESTPNITRSDDFISFDAFNDEIFAVYSVVAQ